MRKIFTIVKKNFLVLLRSRSSAVVIILGPLALMLLVGTAFNSSNIYDIRIGTYFDSYSEVSESINTLLENEQFGVSRFEAEQECIQSVKFGENHVCIVYPPDLSAESEDTTIKFYVDQSRINLIWVILDSVSEQIQTESNEISKQLTKILVDNLNNAKVVLTEKQALLSEVASGTSNSQNQLREITDLFGELNLDSNLTSVDKIQNETKKLREKYNGSSDFKELDLLLTELEATVAKTEGQLRAASNTITSASTSLTEIKQGLSDNTNQINDIRTGVTSVLTGIEGIEVTNEDQIVAPIKTSIEPVSTDSTHLSNLFPALIVLVIMFISILLASMLVIKEKLSKAYFRNFITPTSHMTFILGTYATNILIVLIQLIILFAVIVIFFQRSILNSLLNTSVMLLLIATVFILIGMLIGYIFNSEETSILGAIAVGGIFLIFSNTILPTESIPEALRQIAQYNPFIIAESVLKRLIIFNSPLGAVLNEIYLLVIYAVVLFALVLIVNKLTERGYLFKVLRFTRKKGDKETVETKV